jgi:hypothetical protein
MVYRSRLQKPDQPPGDVHVKIPSEWRAMYDRLFIAQQLDAAARAVLLRAALRAGLDELAAHPQRPLDFVGAFPVRIPEVPHAWVREAVELAATSPSSDILLDALGRGLRKQYDAVWGNRR